MSGEPVCRVVILIAVKDLSDQGGSGTHTGAANRESAATGKSDAALSVAPPGLEPGLS
jgi:hypothetical protein